MDDYSKSSYFGSQSSFSDARDSSTFTRMQQQYWTTKQAVFRKLGKKDDDCIVASDLELDLKLELFQTIEESFLTLLRVLENYQDKLCALAQEENALGRFLKENGKQDKTRAGKIMCNAGKALSYSAQQRLTLRIPLVRLYQEVETFQFRAIVDTLQTIDKMEKARTSYRGSLMWMKDVSQELDPDTCKQMDKFRKVQNHVRKNKLKFDNLKLDTLQKIDLLSFSRCNLFSQALAAYQNSLLNICKKIAYTSNSVAVTTKGYQYYEFSMLKELTETSKKLAEETSAQAKTPPDDDKDTRRTMDEVGVNVSRILFFEAEYHDDEDKVVSDKIKQEKYGKQNDVQHAESDQKKQNHKKKNIVAKNLGDDEKLLNIDINGDKESASAADSELLRNASEGKHAGKLPDDLLCDNSKPDEHYLEGDDLLFLKDLASESSDVLSTSTSANEKFMLQWQEMFGEIQDSSKFGASKLEESSSDTLLSFLPSQLLDENFEYKAKNVLSNDTSSKSENSDMPSSSVTNQQGTANQQNLEKSRKIKQDMSAWFSLFADLDPLANPDLIGQKREGFDDRNC